MVEKRVELIELPIGDLIEFVRVTFRIADGEPEPDAARGRRAIDRGFGAIEFEVRSGFVVLQLLR